MVKKKALAAKTAGDARTAGVDDKRLGQIIRERRLEIKMSQEQLASILGVTFQQVQKYEKGTNRITATRLFAIMTALDMTFEQVAALMALRQGGDDAVAPHTGEETRLILLFRKASGEKKMRMLALLKALVDDENGQH